MLAVGADDEIDLPWRAALEFDGDASAILRQCPHRVAEYHFHVVAHRAEKDTNQVVSHDLDLAIAARLVHWPQRHVVGPAGVGTHRREGEDLRAGVAHRGVESHPFDDLERGAADVDRVPADAQIGGALDQHRPMTAPHQPVGQRRACDAGARDQDLQRPSHSAKIAA